jgi:hypothetical protein
MSVQVSQPKFARVWAPTFSFRPLARAASHWKMALVVLAVTVFAAFVWPTPYRYDHLQAGVWPLLIRVNRFTGQVEQWTNKRGWVKGTYQIPSN